MILILAVVYWSFYRIIKEYNWHSFNRRQGLAYIVTFQDLRFFALERFFAALWHRLTFV